MKKLFLVLLCLISFSVSSYEVSLDSFKKIDAVTEKALNRFEVPGAAIGIIVDGELVFAKGYGFRDLENGLPVTKETLFAIASCSKAFTTYTLGTLVDEKIMDWDDPVIKYLPEFRLIDEDITNQMTIRDLVTHRSGLPRHDFLWYSSELDSYELLSRMQYLDFASGFREKFHYNNLLFMTAGLVVEKIAGISWEEVVKKRIFEPLGMDQANFCVDEMKKNHNFSYPYKKQGSNFKKIPFHHICHIGPAASINANLLDLAKWVSAQLFFGKQLIQRETLEEIQTLQFADASFPKERSSFLGYGLGWFIKSYGGHYLVEHGGKMDGFISNIAFFPQEKIGVIILTNRDNMGSEFVDSVRWTIFDELLDLEKMDWVEKIAKEIEETEEKKEEEEGTTSPHSLHWYVGEYEHPGYGTLEIYLQKGELFAKYNQLITPLAHKQNDTFVGIEDSLTNIRFSFQKDPSKVNVFFESKPISFVSTTSLST